MSDFARRSRSFFGTTMSTVNFLTGTRVSAARTAPETALKRWRTISTPEVPRRMEGDIPASYPVARAMIRYVPSDRSASRPEMASGGVADDGQEPGAEGGRPPELRKTQESLVERLLDHVIDGIRGHPGGPRYGAGLLLVAKHEGLRGPRLLGKRPAHQFRIGPHPGKDHICAPHHLRRPGRKWVGEKILRSSILPGGVLGMEGGDNA